MEEEGSCSFDDLPVECISIVLSKCCPRTICRLAAISRSWAAAATSKETWKQWWSLKANFDSHFPDVGKCESGHDLFQTLRRGAYSRSKESTCKEYMLTVDPLTACISLHVSAFRCLYFYLRNDTQHDLSRLWITPYSLWPTSVLGSSFQHAAALAAGLFHIHGEIEPDFTLPAGDYSLSLRVAKPPPIRSNACFPALCLVTQPSDSLPFINIKLNLHRDGKPARQLKEDAEGISTQEGEEAREPEFWAKSEETDRKPRTLGIPWDSINKHILHTVSMLGAEWQSEDGERVKPWKLPKQPLTWEEFQLGHIKLQDEGHGAASLALDVVLTDLETLSFRGAVWIDCLILSQVP